jgi:uncharacterized protein YjiS (DUF1127 family)
MPPVHPEGRRGRSPNHEEPDMAYVNTTGRAEGRGALTTLAGAVHALQARMARRALYRRTLAELSALGNRELNDMGLSRASLRAVAHEAVYGNGDWTATPR